MWQPLGVQRPPLDTFVLLRADWRQPDLCPFVIVKFDGKMWRWADTSTQWSAQPDDVWHPIQKCPR